MFILTMALPMTTVVMWKESQNCLDALDDAIYQYNMVKSSIEYPSHDHKTPMLTSFSKLILHKIRSMFARSEEKAVVAWADVAQIHCIP